MPIRWNETVKESSILQTEKLTYVALANPSHGLLFGKIKILRKIEDLLHGQLTT